LAARAWDGPTPAIVHLHWPEKLVTGLGADPTIALLQRLKRDGARVVQTIHNVSPHEASAVDASLQRRIDQLTDGVHFFSAEHELLARAQRPDLPESSIVVPHPRYASRPRVRVGCFGRIREYKRTADFAEALLANPTLPVELVVTGHVDSPETAARLDALAATDARLDFRPGFRAPREFNDAISSVDWVAIPYRYLHSSGVLVSALQGGRRILSQRPAGGTELYGAFGRDRWLVVDPWTDRDAVQALTDAIEASGADLTLPSWADATAALTSFYTTLNARRPRQLPKERM
jgi:glycosyltransferase involved in cell wall biosynthesis